MSRTDQLTSEKVLIVDFGGQYKQVIARRVRENSVYCEIKPCDKAMDCLKNDTYKGIILTGGPHSVYEEGAPELDPEILNAGIPILGICYGAQWMAEASGGKVEACVEAEYGRTELNIKESPIFKDVPEDTIVWMSHRDRIVKLSDSFKIVASSKSCPIAAFSDEARGLYGVQFHPEVNHTEKGKEIISNFLFEVCHCSKSWEMGDFARSTIEDIRDKIGDKKALCAFSGGVDSSVAALLVHKAIGKNLTCVFVDHGLLRKDEADTVEEVFGKQFGMNLIRVDASERFLSKLDGVTDPETKRKIIGEEFIRVFEDEAKKIGQVDYLVQGTIYPDVIESGVGGAVIKSHHNVGGLPEDVDFKGLIEPLRDLFKDEVRAVGTELGIPDDLVWRQPFPGPGLAVRIIGNIDREKTRILQDADAIWREEVKKAGLHKEIGQYFAVLTDMHSVGVRGDSRIYGYVLALRAVSTIDFMTAEWARIPHDVLARASERICNEVHEVSRVVYDITGKPPATIEWE